jgi:hypothetical protein
MADARMLSTTRIAIGMDYGQFSVHGAAGGRDDLELLEEARASPPSASDGGIVVVLSPHQNNFDMAIDIEVWDAAPASDRGEWDQVSLHPFRVDPRAKLYLESPTLDGVWVDVAAAVDAVVDVIEISGRGFVNHGWPGSTEPGDTWRIRLWPSDGEPLAPPRVWAMPGA